MNGPITAVEWQMPMKYGLLQWEQALRLLGSKRILFSFTRISLHKLFQNFWAILIKHHILFRRKLNLYLKNESAIFLLFAFYSLNLPASTGDQNTFTNKTTISLA